MPKRGFNNLFRKNSEVVNLDRLQKAIDDKSLDASATITAETMAVAGLVSNNRDGVRLLGKGELLSKVIIEVVGASKVRSPPLKKSVELWFCLNPLRSNSRPAKNRLNRKLRNVPQRWINQLQARPVKMKLLVKYRGKVWVGSAYKLGGSSSPGVKMASAAEQFASNLNFGAFSKATELKNGCGLPLGH